MPRLPAGRAARRLLLVSVAVQDHGSSRRRHQLQGPAWQRPTRVIPDVPCHQIDRPRLTLAGGATQRRQHTPEWTVAPLKQHLHRMQDCPRRTWTSQFKPALGPVGQALVEVEDGRVQGALRAERARVDLLGGRGKRWLARLIRRCRKATPRASQSSSRAAKPAIHKCHMLLAGSVDEPLGVAQGFAVGIAHDLIVWSAQYCFFCCRVVGSNEQCSWT